MAHLQLGRAYALTGDTVNANLRIRIPDSLKDADPDVPILLQSKSNTQKLH